jgi:hypothetical protein
MYSPSMAVISLFSVSPEPEPEPEPLEAELLQREDSKMFQVYLMVPV